MQVPLTKTFLGAFLACALLTPILPAQATISDGSTSITLEKLVYFTGADGSMAVAEPGEYSVEASEEWLRLTPGMERRNALLVETSKGTHEEEVPEPVALSVPGGEEIPDTHVVTLLLPGGEAIDAIGTYSGIRERGLFSGVYKKYKKKYTKKYKRKYTKKYKKKYKKKLRKNPRLAKRILKNPRAFKNNPKFRKELKKNIAKEAREAPKLVAGEIVGEVKGQVEYVGNQIMKVLDTAKCHSIVAAITVGDSLGVLQKYNPLNPVMKEIGKTTAKFTNQIMANANLQTHIKQALPKELDQLTPYMIEANRILGVFKNPANRKKVNAIFSAKNICHGSPKRMVNQLIQLHGKPRFQQASSLVRSRGIPANIAGQGGKFYMSYGIAATVEIQGKGIPFGFFLVTDYKNDTQLNFYIGAQAALSADIALEILFQVGFYNGIKKASDLEQWGMTIGTGVNPTALKGPAAAPMDLSVGIDWAINPKKFFSSEIKNSLQGVLLSGGGSVNFAPGGAGEAIQIQAVYAGH